MEVDETSTNNREVTSSSKMDETSNEIVVASTNNNGLHDELDVTINIFEDQEVVPVGLDSDIDLILEEELSVIFVGRTKKDVKVKDKDLMKEKVKDKVLKKINEEYVPKEYMTKYKEEMKKLISEKDKLINDLMEKLNINKV